MRETIDLGGLQIEVTRKEVKNVHLSVHPPTGRITLVAPENTRLEVARAYAISKLGWIKKQQQQLSAQLREEPRQFIDRETHYLWGRPYLLFIEYKDAKPAIQLDHKHIMLTVRPGCTSEKKAEILYEWQKSLLHETVPSLIKTWEARLGVTVNAYFLQRMKTRWGGCNPDAGHIRINTELVKKPRHLLEYVIVHEMAHLLEPSHSTRFQEIISHNYPAWKEARTELNDLPLGV